MVGSPSKPLKPRKSIFSFNFDRLHEIPLPVRFTYTGYFIMSANQIADKAIELEHKGEEKLDELANKDGPCSTIVASLLMLTRFSNPIAYKQSILSTATFVIVSVDAYPSGSMAYRKLNSMKRNQWLIPTD
jgi:hypothetical protein